MSTHTDLPTRSFSSPVKKSSASLRYQAEPPPAARESRVRMAEEMTDSWIGPMPVGEFLAEFLPLAKRRSPQSSRLFAALEDQTREADMYAPFIRLVHENKLIPGFKIINTSNHPDINSRQGKKIRPDPSMYRADVEIENNITQFEKLELNFEFKLHDIKDPFRDPEPSLADRKELDFESPTDGGKDARGQLASYATEWCSRQHRTFAYTVFLLGSKARLIRWDRSGAIVTEKFDYKEDSQPLIDFLWRFVHLDDAGRGKDTNFREANPDEVLLCRKHLVRWASRHERPFVVFTIKESGQLHEYIGWGSMADADSLIGRATRAYPVYEKATGKIRFLKNAWRALDLEKEADMIREMNAAEVRNVPNVVSGGDIEGQVTLSHKYENKAWRCGNAVLTPRINHMFTTDFVGQTLNKFTSTKQLANAVHDAFIAHYDAVVKCGFLHRDISAGNVMMTDSGAGILNDWDLAKRIVRPPQVETPRNHTRTGTWQFLSYRSLRFHDRMHLIQDDMESFVYVLLYHALRYVESSATQDLPEIMKSVFDTQFYNPRTLRHTGGKGKHHLCADPSCTLGCDFEFRNNLPLTELTLIMLSFVKDWHLFEKTWDPPPKLLTVSKVRSAKILETPHISLEELTFKNHERVMAEWDSVLASPDWPTGDKAIDQLPPEKILCNSSKRILDSALETSTVESMPSLKKAKGTSDRDTLTKRSSLKRGNTSSLPH